MMSMIDNGHLEALDAGKKGQRKRFWSDEEKRSICRQTRAPGVFVAQVARDGPVLARRVDITLSDGRRVYNITIACTRNRAALSSVSA